MGVRYVMIICVAIGGAVKRLVVYFGIIYCIMTVIYLLIVPVVSLEPTLDASRLLKHIPVYGFYGYWRIKTPSPVLEQ